MNSKVYRNILAVSLKKDSPQLNGLGDMSPCSKIMIQNTLPKLQNMNRGKKWKILDLINFYTACILPDKEK